MKGFLDKTWAKAAAFVLTLVFGVLTVLGGVGVGILISYDVFLDGGDFLRQTMYEGAASDPSTPPTASCAARWPMRACWSVTAPMTTVPLKMEMSPRRSRLR